MNFEENCRPMSLRQAEILDAIAAHIAQHGYPPSVREVGEKVGLSSPSSVHHHLCRLEELGLLTRTAGRCRAMTPAESGAAA